MRTLFAVLLLLPVAGAEFGDHEQAYGPSADGAPPRWEPAEGYDWLDLLDLSLAPAGDHIEFVLRPGGPPADEAIPVDATVDILFSYAGRDYRINLTLTEAPKATLFQVDGAVSRNLSALPATWSGSWSIVASRDLVKSALDEPMSRTPLIEGLAALAWGQSSQFEVQPVPPYGTSASTCGGQPTGQAGPYLCTLRLRDRLPDTGALPAVGLDFRGEAGPWSMEVAQPIRGSNGQATTHVFSTFLENHQQESVTLRIKSWAIPEDWVVNHAGAVTIHPDEMAQLVVTAEVPFEHRHGGQETFQLSASDGVRNRTVEVGLRYLEVPQPSGHHRSLFVHRDPNNERIAWMNTLTADPDGIRGVLRPSFESAGVAGAPSPGTTYRANYQIPLQPDLVLGLDADLSQQGTLNLQHITDWSTTLTVEGEIRMHSSGGTIEPLFMLEATEAHGETKVALIPTARADLVHVDQPTSVELFLTIHGETSAPDRALYEAGQLQGSAIDANRTWLTLPLIDVEEGSIVAGPTEFRLTTDSNRELSVAPGGTRVVALELIGVEDARLRLEGAGASLSEVDEFPRDGRAHLQFTAPTEATPGATFDVVVIATTREGPYLEAPLRLRFVIDAETPSDAPVFDADKPTSASLVAVFMAVALVTLRRLR